MNIFEVMGKVSGAKKQGSKDALRSALMALYAKDTGALRAASQKNKTVKKVKTTNNEAVPEPKESTENLEPIVLKAEITTTVVPPEPEPLPPVVLGDPIHDENARPFIITAYQQSERFNLEAETGLLVDIVA